MNYRVHMVSFKNMKDDGHGVLLSADQALPWQIEELERFLAECKDKCPDYGKDLLG